jgi:large subunit ribosomal protein L24
MKLSIKKGDTVQVIAGADKGKKGAVLAVEPKLMKLKVEGVKVMTHFDKKDGLKKLEGLIDYSNVKLVEKVSAEKKKTAKKKSASKNS